MTARHFLFLLIFFISACSQLQVTSPNPKTEIPELPGTQSIHIQIEGNSAHTYKATNDASARPPTTSRPSVEKSGTLSAGFGYSPIAPIEFGADVDPFNGLGSLFAKYQAFGETFNNSQEGNISGLIHARLGGAYVTKKGDQKGEFGPGGYPWKGSIQSEFINAGVSLGYRVTPTALAFIGNSYGIYWNKTKIDQTAANGDAGGTYNLSAVGRAQDFGGGVVLSFNSVYLVLGLDYSHIGYATDSDVYDTNYRVGVVLF